MMKQAFETRTTATVIGDYKDKNMVIRRRILDEDGPQILSIEQEVLGVTPF